MSAQTVFNAHHEIQHASTSTLVQRVRGEYTEMPGLTLTVRQAARLWDLDVRQSQCLLSELEESRFLVRDSSGSYRRRSREHLN